MKDKNKTKAQLLTELAEFRQKMADLQAKEVEREAALNKAQEKYRDLVESLNDAIYEVDPGGIITYMSPAIETMAGYTVSEVVGQDFARFISPQDLPHIVQQFQQVLAGHGQPDEYRIVTKTGQARWVRSHSRPFYIEGKPAGIRGVLTDITERKQAEEALRESEEKYRTLSSNIPGMIYRGRADWSTDIISNSEMVCGYSVDEFDTQKVNWLDLIHPDDRQRIFEKGSRLPEKPISMVQEYRILAKDGRTRWVSDHKTSFFDEDGLFIGVDGIVYDVTARKQAEERMKFLAEVLSSSPLSVIATDEGGKIIYVNPATERLFGYTRDELLGQNPTILNTDPDADKMQKDIFETIGQGKTWRGEILNKRKNGEVFPVYASVYQLLDEAENFIAMVGFQEDITARKRAETDLQDSVQDLKIAYEQAKIYAEELTQEIGERKQAQAEIEKLNAKLEQRIADRTRELAALYDATAVASASLDLETMLEQLLKSILLAMRSNSGYIHLLAEAADTPDENMLHLAVAQGLSLDQLDRLKTIAVGQGLAGWVAGHDELLVAPDVTADPRTLEFTPEKKLGYTGAPIRVSGKVLGTLSVLNTEAQSFSAEEVALLASVADQIGIIVESARLRQQAEQAAVLAERERLARDLHDAVTQSLYSLPLFAETGLKLVETGQVDGQVDRQLDLVTQNLTRIRDVALQALKEMRLLIHELTPLDLSRGLAEALHRRLHAVEERAKIKTKLIAKDPIELPLSIEEGLYRIAQEALNNALKHANATEVTVCLNTTGGQVELEILDNGNGFDPETVDGTGGMGLANMRERTERLGGLLSVDSNPAEGTRIKVSVKVYENP